MRYYDDIPCRGCEKDNSVLKDTDQVEQRYDYYGYSTGFWCESCYQSNKYPYRKDGYYDYFNAGESLDGDS